MSPVDASIPARDVMPAEERAMLEKDPELAKLRVDCIQRTLRFKYWGQATGVWGWLLLIVLCPFASLIGCGAAIVVGGFTCAAITSEQPHEIGKLNPPWERCMDHGTLPFALLVGAAMIPLTVAGHRKQEEERRNYRHRLESVSLKTLLEESVRVFRSWQHDRQREHEEYRDQRLARSIGQEVASRLRDG
jgi:hypothetical protein